MSEGPPELYHYVVAHCACGYEPDDAMADDEACQALLDHITDHTDR